MGKQNCWEFKNCGREPGGHKAGELGVCPAATEVRADGMNCGKNGGRSCWAVTGTLCGGSKQGSFAGKLVGCQQCEFYQVVRQEEGSAYVSSRQILDKLAA